MILGIDFDILGVIMGMGFDDFGLKMGKIFIFRCDNGYRF